MKFHVNNLVLVLGLIFQSILVLGGAGKSPVFGGLCAWMSIPYWILFFANLHSNKTFAAKAVVTVTIYIVVIGSSLLYSMYDLKADALNGLAYLFLPGLTIAISSLVLTVAVFLDRMADWYFNRPVENM